MKTNKQESRFCDACKSDSGIETIDLSKLTTATSEEDRDLIDLNKRVKIEHPSEWIYFPSDGGDPRFIYDKSGWHEPPNYRNSAGQRVKPTQIVSLLTQNPTGGTRPASTFFWWKQPDEGYYIAQAKKGIAEFLAETGENYYIVEETSEHRLKFVCSDHSRGGTSFNPYPLYVGSKGQAPANIGPISIYINPANDQASWICPKCTYLNSKKYGGDGHAVKHVIERWLRDELARDGIIPAKEYKHKDRLAEADKLLEVIRKNPGSSFYELDHLMGWESDGDYSQRIINKHLKPKVDLKKGRKGHKGYKVYLKK